MDHVTRILPQIEQGDPAARVGGQGRHQRGRWVTLHSDTSCLLDKPHNGRITVRVFDHLGDEVMKVLRVE